MRPGSTARTPRRGRPPTPLGWFSALFNFGSPVLLALYAVAFRAKLRARSLRFYDLLPPAAVLFFLFYPDYGGFQYGPRYWFFAWPLLPLTVAALLRDGGALRLGRFRPDPGMLAALQACVFLGFGLGYAAAMHRQIDSRAALYREVPQDRPAVVLVRDHAVRLTRLQAQPQPVDARDFVRNGVDFDRPVLYGRDLPGALAAACALRGGSVFLWQGPGTLERLPCG